MTIEDSALEQLKTPPHSRDAEQSLLGGLLLDAQTWDQVAGMFTKDDFYLPEHRLIFEAMFKVSERNRPLDVLTLWFGELRAEFAAPSQPANRASGNGDNNGKHGNQGRIHGLSDPQKQQWSH